MKCNWHSCNNEVSGKRKLFCSNKCSCNFATKKRRKELKKLAVELLGNKCCVCGYCRCTRALEFHHLDPSIKSFEVSSKSYNKSWELIKLELDKCILVCSNCHREIEDKFIDINGLLGESARPRIPVTD